MKKFLTLKWVSFGLLILFSFFTCLGALVTNKGFFQVVSITTFVVWSVIVYLIYKNLDSIWEKFYESKKTE